AYEIQKRLERGEAGPLAGCVIGIKDIICEKGKRTSCASNILKGFESIYDATVIRRLKEADALLIGRLNMDEFGMGSSNENSIYGPVRNPHDETRVPGGSSGGSAAAVAANLCTAALGSDTGGSIRQPASFCGVVGLKPTWGRVSRYGLVAFASSFDSIGPLTNSVTDAALVLQSIAGEDPEDGTSSAEPVPDYTAGLEADEVLRVGVPEEYFGEGLHVGVRNVIDGRLKQLEKERKVELKPISLPHSRYSIATYYILATAEASSNLARFDGVRYGHRSDVSKLKEELREEREALQKSLNSSRGDQRDRWSQQLDSMDSALIRLYKRSRTEGFGREVKRRIMLGTYVLSAGYYDAYYAKAQKVRRLIRQDFLDAFSEVDVIAGPTAPTTAFELGARLNDPVQMYLNDIYTTAANLAGICGISVPAGILEGLPVGIQFLGNRFEEQKILRAGRLIELLEGQG
ncbi:MAG: amidase family protein, partial [Balneolaceae bacterium]